MWSLEAHVPPQRCIRGQAIYFVVHLNSVSSGKIDQVKNFLQHRVKAATGRRPQLPSFQLHQAGRHVAFAEPITVLWTLEPVVFVRVAPDARD